MELVFLAFIGGLLAGVVLTATATMSAGDFAVKRGTWRHRNKTYRLIEIV